MGKKTQGVGELVCLYCDKHKINSSFLTHLVASSKWRVAQEIPHVSSVPPALDMQEQGCRDPDHARETAFLSHCCTPARSRSKQCDVYRIRMPYLLWVGNIWRSWIMESWCPCPVVREELCPAHPA